jgi:hypothetical protein
MELEYESKRPLYIPYAGPILLEFPLLVDVLVVIVFEVQELTPGALGLFFDGFYGVWQQAIEGKHCNRSKHCMELEYESKRPLYIPYAGPILLEFPLPGCCAGRRACRYCF